MAVERQRGKPEEHHFIRRNSGPPLCRPRHRGSRSFRGSRSANLCCLAVDDVLFLSQGKHPFRDHLVPHRDKHQGTVTALLVCYRQDLRHPFNTIPDADGMQEFHRTAREHPAWQRHWRQKTTPRRMPVFPQSGLPFSPWKIQPVSQRRNGITLPWFRIFPIQSGRQGCNRMYRHFVGHSLGTADPISEKGKLFGDRSHVPSLSPPARWVAIAPALRQYSRERNLSTSIPSLASMQVLPPACALVLAAVFSPASHLPPAIRRHNKSSTAPPWWIGIPWAARTGVWNRAPSWARCITGKMDGWCQKRFTAMGTEVSRTAMPKFGGMYNVTETPNFLTTGGCASVPCAGIRNAHSGGIGSAGSNVQQASMPSDTVS